MALTMKNAVFWDVTPYGSCKNWRFAGTYRLHHDGAKNRRVKNNTFNNYKPKHAAKKYNIVPRSPILVTLMMEGSYKSHTA
jgi:hypothetical protein